MPGVTQSDMQSSVTLLTVFAQATNPISGILLTKNIKPNGNNVHNEDWSNHAVVGVHFDDTNF